MQAVKELTMPIPKKSDWPSTTDGTTDWHALFEDEEKEHISGYFLKAELLESLVQGKGDARLGTIKRDITVVFQTLPISDLFNQFLGKREHIALGQADSGVRDHHGTIPIRQLLDEEKRLHRFHRRFLDPLRQRYTGGLLQPDHHHTHRLSGETVYRCRCRLRPV